MDRTERFYRIDCLLRSRRAVGIKELEEKLEVSKPTVKRDLAYLRDRFNAPISYDHTLRGYRFTDPVPDGPRYELPGLWFNSTEIHALLTFYHLLENLQPGLLDPHIQPLQARIRALLKKHDHTFEEVARRIRVLPQAARSGPADHFSVIAHAVLKRRRLMVVHYSRSRDEETRREVSPQRLVHYRDNWYLDAWDHGKKALRTFAVDAIRHASLLDAKARTIPDKALNAELGGGYGIFAGRKTQTARLRFSPERARWVETENWHPKQKGYYEGGHYILEIPYADDRELLMDILKYGPDVEVLAPKSLRRKVMDTQHSSMQQYHE